MASRGSAGGSLYFAYGSNLWISQMAKRCPESSFKGKGTLEGYRWQINQRGVANVVKAPGQSVEGLVFSVTASDVRTLDRNEGISRKFYERQFLPVILEEHPLLANQKTAQVARWLEQNRDDKDVKIMSGAFEERYPAVVYVSEKFKDDGPIRTEYIKRMQSAAADAIALGVSTSWVNGAMGRYISPAKAEPPAAPAQTPSQPTARLDRLGEGGTRRSAAAAGAPSGEDTASSGAGRPPRQASAAGLPTYQSDPISLRDLREANRKNGADSGVAFPPTMLEGVKRSSGLAAQDEGDERVYLVFVSKRLPRSGADPESNGAVRVHWSTMDLELANELAMYRFRSLWSRICADSLEGGFPQWGRVTRGGQRAPGLSWDLSDDACLSLHGSVGETTSATVWVEPQTLIRSCT
ncbi:hypothetical protein B0T24DRAFT_626240 [Lasiosphaeria ovina]|uniref:gamma-glutamylcyclotransferase n=1 Tax=Lasiosphaeria ovina TaxID=92902 RepID=A0AAE0KCL5_9PEZI|nr:hypothetical protein B0T24DRAFT_626240 [Lasiosphaeria ovina]